MSGVVVPLIPKQSTVAAHVPTTGQLQVGEIALNIRDGILYGSVKLDGTTNTVLALGGTGFLTSAAAATTYLPLTGGTISGTTTFSGLTASTVMMLNSSKALVSAALSNGLTAGSGTLTVSPSNMLPTVPAVKTAAYTAVQADNNTTIVFNSSSALAITLPTLAAGTSFTVAQRGTGKVTWTASGTTVTPYPSGTTGSAGAGAQMTFYYDTTTTILVGGALA
jgi:hypothetical protein